MPRKPMDSSSKNVPQILVAALTTYERGGWPTKELADFLILQRHNPRYAWEHSFAHNFIPAAAARNTVAKSFKDAGADWILMIDNDMSPPVNLFDCIQDAPADAGVVVPVFYLWDGTARVVKLCWGFDDGVVDPADAHKMIKVEPKFYELTKCGTGCIFIRPEVFQKVPAPWFWYTYDENWNQTSTEDINFSLKIREHGFKIYGNGAFSVGHHHTVDLSAIASLLYDFKKEETPAAVIHSSERPSEEMSQGEPARPAGESSPVEETSPVR